MISKTNAVLWTNTLRAPTKNFGINLTTSETESGNLINREYTNLLSIPDFQQKFFGVLTEKIQKFRRDVRTPLNLSQETIWGKTIFLNFFNNPSGQWRIFFWSFGGIFSARSHFCFLSLTWKVGCKIGLWKKLIWKVNCDSYWYLNGVLVKLWQCCRNWLLPVQKSSMRKNGLCGSKIWKLLRTLSRKNSQIWRNISDRIVKTASFMSKKHQGEQQ